MNNTPENTKKIYSRLADSLSKKIFDSRLEYSFTGDTYKLINGMFEYGFKNCYNEETKYVCNPQEKFVVYGAGGAGRNIAYFIGNSRIIAFCDSDENKWNTTFMGRRVISPAQLRESYIKDSIVIAINDGDIVSEVTDELVRLGFDTGQLSYYGLLWDPLKYFQKLMYFDKSVIQYNSNIEEVFVDAGCMDGETSMGFIKWCNGNYRSIVAFEPDPNLYLNCAKEFKHVRNLTIHPFGLWHENTTLRFDSSTVMGASHIVTDANQEDNILEIKVKKLDDILNGEKVTFIKMDIEGAELNALRGAEQTIAKYRPKLAISVYHKPEDIYEIPLYILSLNSDYKFYLRHYNLGFPDTVLYAV
jgi:FkbM family methyltransferase